MLGKTQRAILSFRPLRQAQGKLREKSFSNPLHSQPATVDSQFLFCVLCVIQVPSPSLRTSFVVNSLLHRLSSKVRIPVCFHSLPDVFRRESQALGTEIFALGRIDEQLGCYALGSGRWVEPQAEGIRDNKDVFIGLHASGDRPLDFLRAHDVDVVVEHEMCFMRLPFTPTVAARMLFTIPGRLSRSSIWI